MAGGMSGLGMKRLRMLSPWLESLAMLVLRETRTDCDRSTNLVL